MSIITEALKKAQSSKVQNTKDLSPTHFQTRDLPKPIKHSFVLSFLKYTSILLLSVLATVLITLTLNNYTALFSNNTPPSAKMEATETETKTNITIKNSKTITPVTVTEKPSSTQITGIKPKSSIAYKKQNAKRSLQSLFWKKHNLSLRGIMSSNGAPVAVINDNVVRIGDDIDGATVIEILDQSVKIEYNGHIEILKLKK